MPMLPLRIVFLTLSTVVVLTPIAFSAFVVDFTNQPTIDMFIGDGVGDTAGPFVIDGQNRTLTTTAISHGGTLSTEASPNFALAIDSNLSGEDPTEFGLGESWAFEFDGDVFLTGVNLTGLNSANHWTLSSTDWVGLTIPTGSANVSFDSSTGTITLDGSETVDDFTLFELTGANDPLALPILASTDVLIASDVGDATSNIESLTFHAPTAVPEPSSWIFLGLVACCVGSYRYLIRPLGIGLAVPGE